MGRSQQQPAESAYKNRISTQQFEAFCAALPDAIVVWDRAGKILYLNAAALTLFEIQPSDSWLEMSSQQFLQHYTWCDEQQRPFVFAPWLLKLPTLHKGAEPRSDEQTLVLSLPSQRKVFLELRCSQVLNAEQQPIGMLAAFHEVSPRYQKALHIQWVYEALGTLNEAIARLPKQFHMTDPAETLLFSPPVLLVAQQLVDVIRQVLACWRVSLIAFRSSTLYASYVVGSGFTAVQEQERRELNGRFLLSDCVDETVLAHLQANQEVILSTDCIRIPPAFPIDFAPANLLIVPLFLEQNLAGMFLIHKQGWDRGYSREEIDLVRAVTAQALLFMDCLGSLQKPVGEQARDRVLPEVDRLSNDFLTLASHELRTPLTAIKGNLQLAQRRLERLKRALDEQSERMSEHIEQTQQSLASAGQSVRLQERMVQDVIDDMSIQADQLDLSLKPCDLLILLKLTVAHQQASVPDRAIELEVLTPQPTIPVFVDAERITRVLTIYLTNSLNSSPAERAVIVQVQEENALARISVHDEGPDIPPEELDYLWDRFSWVKGSTVQQERELRPGSHFYLCQVLIERHHGTVGVQSAPNQGTTFWLTVPIARSAGA